MKETVFKTAPMLLIMGAVFLLSHQPGNTFEMMPFIWSDKLIHLTVYGLMASSVLYALPVYFKKNNSKMTVVLIILVCFIYGCSDEFHQSFIPGRCPSLGDIAADTVGAVLFCAGWFLYQRQIKS